jgi:hypothetical protein
MGKNHTPLELLWEDQKLSRASKFWTDIYPLRFSKASCHTNLSSSVGGTPSQWIEAEMGLEAGGCNG